MAFSPQVQKGASPPAHELEIGHKSNWFSLFLWVQRRCFARAQSERRFVLRAWPA